MALIRMVFVTVVALAFLGFVFQKIQRGENIIGGDFFEMNSLNPIQKKPVVPKLCGVNMSGAEFGESNLPGKMDADYIYPQENSEYAYFADKKQELIRIPFRWERLQLQANGELSQPDLAGLKKMVATAGANHQKVILDLHNYGRYYNQPLSSSQAAQLISIWQKLDAEFRNSPTIYGYELMNEPHDLPDGGASWGEIMQQTVTALRETGTTTKLLIPGYSWQHPDAWAENNPGYPLQDPQNNLVYTAHQYFDADHSGTYKESQPSATTNLDVVRESQPFLTWLQKNNAQGMFTEFGVPATKPWLAVLDTFLQNIYSSDNILGATYWSAGPWWGKYNLSIEPVKNRDQPQLAVLERYCVELAP